MDPLWQFLQRTNKNLHLELDNQYVYRSSDDLPSLAKLTTPNSNIYLSTELLQEYMDIKAEIVTSREDIIVKEHAHPLSKINDFVDGDVDKKYLRKLFGFKHFYHIIRSNRTLLNEIYDYLTFDHITRDPKTHDTNDPLVIRVQILSSELDANLIFALTPFFEFTTILQPAFSASRYLIFYNKKTDNAKMKIHLEKYREDLINVLRRVSDDDPITSFIQIGSMPIAFCSWLYNINNIYVSINAEILIHEIEAKNAFDKRQRESYFNGVSYDIRKGVKLIKGEPIDPPLIIPMGPGPKGTKQPLIGFKQELSSEDRFEIHLFGEPEFMEHLHRELDIENDEKVAYHPRKGELLSGDYWGQRKLLISTTDFLTQNTEPNQKTFCIYIGAAPFNNGKILLKWFPNVNFWLIDGREASVFDQGLNNYIPQSRVMISGNTFFDDRFANGVIQFLQAKTDKEKIAIFKEYFAENTTSKVENLVDMLSNIDKILFISDIRSIDMGDMTRTKREDEESVDRDNRLQAEYLQQFIDASTKYIKSETVASNKFAASLKFRLPYEYPTPDYEYIKGIIRIQPWAPFDSTETRLWVTEVENYSYNLKAYEEAMAYHNTKIRSATFGEHDFGETHDSCHDCHLELVILKEYCQKFNVGTSSLQANETDLAEKIEDKTFEIENIFKLSLQEHIQRHEDRTKIRKLDGFNPYEEILRYNLRSTLKKDFETIVSNELKKTNLNKEIKLIYLDLVLFEWTIYASYGEAKEKFIAALISLFKTRANTIISTKIATKILDQLAVKTSQLRDKFENDINGESPNISINYKTEGSLIEFTADYVGFGTKAQTLTTLKVHKELLKKFLTAEEEMFDFTIIDLLNNQIFKTRAFCILLRYKAIWNKNLALSPNLSDIKLLKLTSEGEFNGFESCANILSAYKIIKTSKNDVKTVKFNKNYNPLFPFEKQFTLKDESIFSEDFIPNDELVIVFPSNVEPIMEAYIQRWKELLEKYKNSLLEVVFIVPEKYVEQLMDSKLAFIANITKLETKVNIAFNYITNKEEKLDEERVVIIIKH